MAMTNSDVERRARRRARSITAVFVAVQILIVLFGAVGLEGVNILRSYAAGDAHWSKAQKSAIVALSRYAETRSEKHYRDFIAAMSVTHGDRVARITLQHMHFVGTAAERTRAADGFVQGGNDRADAPGLVWGFILFERWPPFAAAVSEWARGDIWADQLLGLGAEMHNAVRDGASNAEMTPLLSRAIKLDGELSRNEEGYARHMAEASRIALWLTLATFALLSIVACGIGVYFVRRIAHRGERAETRAIENETRVRDFAELASDWFCEIDKDTRIGFVATRLSGVNPAEDISGRNWIETGLAQGFEQMSEDVQHGKALRDRKPFRSHCFKQTRPDGSVMYWSISGKPMFDETGAFAGFRITGSDITDMIHTQEELKRARDEAERANKAKSAFLANMSHELRTPLNAILGFSGFIEHQAMGEIANKRYVEYAGDIRESGEHLLAIINDLLEHSRVEAGKTELREERFDIAAAIEQARLFCEPRAQSAGVQLRTRIAPGLPPVLGDELRIRQVLINLVSNAVKFTPDGTVDIVARIDGGGCLRIDVRDTGIGMDQAGIEQALKPFGQVDSGLSRKFEGTGLGLPLAKSLVELHGGTLSVASERGQGTVVTVVLPAWRVKETAPVEAA
ncbi:MAG TPA: ATP-binding protein [Rhizomicrobium sp.]|nr:ATP-binding protein [Rhizomicrobium sp.]